VTLGHANPSDGEILCFVGLGAWGRTRTGTAAWRTLLAIDRRWPAP